LKAFLWAGFLTMATGITEIMPEKELIGILLRALQNG
jgi:hypothetical protein